MAIPESRDPLLDILIGSGSCSHEVMYIYIYIHICNVNPGLINIEMGGTPPIDMFIFNVQYVYIYYYICMCVCAHVIVPPCLFLPSICCSLRLRCGWLPAHGKTLLFCKFLKSILFLATTDLHTCIYIYMNPWNKWLLGSGPTTQLWMNFDCLDANDWTQNGFSPQTVLLCYAMVGATVLNGNTGNLQKPQTSNTMTAVIDLSLLLVEFPACPC